jgi:hypothetical protein
VFLIHATSSPVEYAILWKIGYLANEFLKEITTNSRQKAVLAGKVLRIQCSVFRGKRTGLSFQMSFSPFFKLPGLLPSFIEKVL